MSMDYDWYWQNQRAADAEFAERMERERIDRSAGVLKDAAQRVATKPCRRGCACAGGLGYCND